METVRSRPIQSPFDIEIVKHTAAVTVEVRGELDVATAPLLGARLAEVEAADAAVIVLDIAGVPFIDSTGLRALLQAHVRNGERLRITEGCDQARRLFELAGVLKTLPFVSSAERAELEA